MAERGFATITDQYEVLARVFALAGQPVPDRQAKAPEVKALYSMLEGNEKVGQGPGQFELIVADVADKGHQLCLIAH